MENLNPFERFSNTPEVLELIVQHLKVDDVLRITETSTFNNDLVFELSRKKIILRVNKTNVDRMLETKRCYHSIGIKKIVNSEVMNNLMEIFWAVESIELCDAYWVLDKLHSAVNMKELTLENINRLKTKESWPTLGRVETLTLIDCCFRFATAVIKNCEHLRKLSIRNFSNMDSLLSNLAAQEDSNNCRLEDLYVSDYSFYSMQQQKTELFDFLILNMNSLRVLKLDIWPTVPVLELIMTMPKLSFLSIYELAKSNPFMQWEEITLPKSSSINRLCLEDLKDQPKLLQCILKSCPKVKCLRVHMIDDEIAQVIATCASNLIDLQCDISNWNNVNLENMLKRNRLNKWAFADTNR